MRADIAPASMARAAMAGVAARRTAATRNRANAPNSQEAPVGDPRRQACERQEKTVIEMSDMRLCRCPVCGSLSALSRRSRTADTRIFRCPACGPYEISGTALYHIVSLPDEARTAWLAQARSERSPESAPVLTLDQLSADGLPGSATFAQDGPPAPSGHARSSRLACGGTHVSPTDATGESP